MDSRLKHFLKWLKEQESVISMMLGALVVIAVGSLIFSYYSDNRSIPLTDPFSQTAATSPESIGLDQEELQTLEFDGEYIVKPGDHLWKIAQTKYGSGYRHADIAAANNIDLNAPLFVGQRLTLPLLNAQDEVIEERGSEDGGSALQTAVPDQNLENKSTYTVTRGDTLWSIAVSVYQDGYRWSEIVESNPELIRDPSLIEVGWVLQI